MSKDRKKNLKNKILSLTFYRFTGLRDILMERENLLAKTKQELVDLREYKVRDISNQFLTKKLILEYCHRNASVTERILPKNIEFTVC